MPARLTPEAAIAVMRAVGYEPLEPFPGSQKKWLVHCNGCGLDREVWYASARSGSRCAVCTGRARIDDTVARAAVLARGFEALEPYPGSEAKWLARCLTCKTERPIRFRAVTRGTGCAVCNGNARIDDKVAEQQMLDAGLRPLEPYKNVTAPWRCVCLTCGKQSSPALSHIRHSGAGCRHCAGNVKYDQETAAAFMRERDLEPLEAYPGANAKWRCKCLQCGNEVSPMLTSIRSGRGGCRYCGAAAIRLDADQATALMRQAGFEPLVPYPGSSKAWPCRCTRCGDEVTPTYAAVKAGHGCRKCAGIGLLEASEAVARMLAAGYRPLVPYVDTATKWPSECLRCGRTVEPRLNQITTGFGGCAHCAGNARLEHDVATQAMRNAGLEPLVPYPGSSKKWLCRYTRCGKDVSPTHNGVSRGKGGCVYCAGSARLEHDTAAEVMRTKGLEPLTPYPGSAVPWLSQCVGCGAHVATNYSAVRRGQGGCGACRMNLALPGRSMGVYLMTHEDLHAVKVGIGVVHGPVFQRVATHQQRGWALHAVWTGIPDHRIAAGVERRVLNRWRAERVAGFVARADMPQGGWSETAPLARVNLDDVVGEIVVGIGEVADALPEVPGEALVEASMGELLAA
jgi:hypothetical protein